MTAIIKLLKGTCKLDCILLMAAALKFDSFVYLVLKLTSISTDSIGESRFVFRAKVAI